MYQNLTITHLRQQYLNKTLSPKQLFSELLEKAALLQQDNVWISLFTEQQVDTYLNQLETLDINACPLWGIPFAVKDNIDVAGVETTAACAEFAYMPEQNAAVVQVLVDAGAIPIGKTNLDQFATGLVGTRSPYGATANAFKSEYLSGGSSSGSAVAVAKGVVSFSLGTDTAGSGRVPAAFNNLVGLKPSKGLLSTQGVVPACRSLDCVSIFATTIDDANSVFDVAARYDERDCYSRANPAENTGWETPFVNAGKSHFSFAVPKAEQLQFFGCSESEQAFSQALTALTDLGGEAVEIDFEPFLDAAILLYEGPWVAERYAATKALLDSQPEAFLEVTRNIITGGKDKLAVDAFSAAYKLQALKKIADKIMAQVDFMVTPTAGRHFTIDDVQKNPIELNSQLGYYTNYMNLLDYAALAVPTGFKPSGLPFGISLVGFAFSDKKLLSIAHLLEQTLKLPLGATGWKAAEATSKKAPSEGWMDVVVCGAHLSGMPLNKQLIERGAYLVKTTKSAAHYRMYSVAGEVERPAMIREENNGVAIPVELWRLPISRFGSFVLGIAAPLGIGRVELEDGLWYPGFIAEGRSKDIGQDITSFKGWRSYVASKN